MLDYHLYKTAVELISSVDSVAAVVAAAVKLAVLLI
jgi:hypothetical protein